MSGGATCSALAAALRDAAACGDIDEARVGAARLANELTRPGAPLPDREAIDTLKMLIGRRWFAIADPLAEHLAHMPDAAAELQRRAAQVMLERCRYAPALKLLLALRQARRADQAEVLGHIGRIRKQQYVESVELGESDDKLLQLATRTYLEAYREDRERRTWHGINAVALLRLCEQAPGGLGFAAGDATRLAKEISRTLTAQPASDRQPWDIATAAEAALSLGDFDAAAARLREYVPLADAFGLGATLRQFEQIWRIGDLPDPRALALRDLLRAALLEKEGGTLPVDAGDVARALEPAVQYEAVFGTDRFDSLENYRRGLERCACVARIGRSADTGEGTGFLIDAAALGFRRVTGPVLVTNAHVMSRDPAERQKGAMDPAEAIVTFSARPGIAPTAEFTVTELLFTSPRDQLDATIVRLTPELGELEALPLAPVLPVRDSKALVRAIGHPSGRGLSFSVNELLDHETPRVHYRTATEGGSSGSPVFNQEWRLIALHHLGGHSMSRLNGAVGQYEANEGIWIGAIRQAVDNSGL